MKPYKRDRERTDVTQDEPQVAIRYPRSSPVCFDSKSEAAGNSDSCGERSDGKTGGHNAAVQASSSSE